MGSCDREYILFIRGKNKARISITGKRFKPRCIWGSFKHFQIDNHFTWWSLKVFITWKRLLMVHPNEPTNLPFHLKETIGKPKFRLHPSLAPRHSFIHFAFVWPWHPMLRFGQLSNWGKKISTFSQVNFLYPRNVAGNWLKVEKLLTVIETGQVFHV